MRSVFAAWKVYNANPKNRRVGDCVKRSISLAFKDDYTKVAKELNELKNQLRWPIFNSPIVYHRYIKDRGYIKKGAPSDFGVPAGTTVQQFCESHPNGVYLIETKKPGYGAKYIDHIICVINGDYFDSWDSGKEELGGTMFLIQESDADDVWSDESISSFREDLKSQLQDILTPYVQKLISKFPVKATVSETAFRELNDTHINVWWKIVFDREAVQNMHDQDYPMYSALSPWILHDHVISITVSINIRKNPEKAMADILEKAKPDTREAFYQLRHDMDEAMKRTRVRSQIRDQGKKYSGSISLLSKLPDWVIPYATWGSMNENAEYDRYYLDMNALPDDPRREKDPVVRFHDDTLSDLRYNLERYRKEFKRVDYDY